MDLAELGLRFTPAGDADANRALDQITEKSKTAEKATDSLAGSMARNRGATQQSMAELLKSVQAIEGLIRAQGGLARAQDLATAKATSGVAATNALATAQRSAAAGAEKVAATARATATAFDAEAMAAKRLADQMERVKRGELKAVTNPANGVVSYVPAMAREADKAAAAAAGVALQQLDAHVGAYRQHVDQAGQSTGRFGAALRNLATDLFNGGGILQSVTRGVGDFVSGMGSGAGGVGGVLSGVLRLLNPVTIGITLLGIATVGAAKAAYDYAVALERLEQLASGVGRSAGLSAQQLEAAAEAGARASGSSVGQAREFEAQLLQTGRIGGAVFEDLIGAQKRYANATGQDLASAQADLARMFADPAKGAEELQAKFGSLTASQVDYIRTLAEAGDKTGAQTALMDALGASVQGVSGHLPGFKGFWDGVTSAVSRTTNGIVDAINAAQDFILLGPALTKAMKDKAEAEASAAQRSATFNQASTTGLGVAQSLDPDAQRRRALEGQRATLASGAFAAQMTGDSAAWETQAAALGKVNRALESYLPDAEKAHRVAELDAQANQVRAQKETAATRAKLGSIAAEKARIALSGQIKSASEVEQAAADASAVASSRQSRASNNHADSLAREAAAMVANAAGALTLADAYLQGSAAALKAEAMRKAATDSTRKGTDLAAQAQRQLNLDIAESIVTGAKGAAATQAQADAQSAANDSVQFGNVAAEVAQQNMQAELALRPLLAAAALTQGDALNKATAAIEVQRKATADLAAEQLKARNLATGQSQQDQIAIAQKELELIGATNRERTIAIALLQAEQQQRAAGYDPANATDKQRAAHDAAVKGAGDVAGITADLRTANDNYNNSLTATLNLLEEIAAHTATVAQGLGEGFGRAGDAIGGLISNLAAYRAYQEQLNVSQAAERKAAGNDAKRLGEIEALYAKKRQNAEVEANLASLSSFKQLFSHKSGAYKVLTGIETAYRALQLAGMVKEMAMDAISTAKTIGLALARATAHGVEAVARAMASVPFPFNLAAAAATAAALVAFGVKLFGGGGSSSSLPSAEERQKTQGTGTVLGDAAAKSDSIAHALDLVAANTNKDLEYSNGMLRALRNIDNNIGALTGLLARQLGVGGAFDTTSLGLGTKTGFDSLGALIGVGPIGLALSQVPIIGGIIKSLFGTKSTTTLLDQGVEFDPSTVGQIAGSGLSGSSYQDIETQKKKKFFGITVSNKTKTATQTTPLEDDILAEMQRIVSSLRDGVLAAATALGVEGADAALNAFVVDIGKISFKDKTGQEIQDELNAVFSKLGDQMSETILPAITELQQAGEGAFETLIRVAREYQVVDVTLQAMGKTFGAVGVASIAARDDLVQLFGSLDDFVSASAFFTENFLSEAERIAPIQAAVVKEFQRLGVTGVNTKDQFKQLVLGLDLTSQAGRDMYAAMLAVAPAFAKVFDYLNPAVQDAAKSVADLRQDLTDAYKAEADALQGTIDKFRGFADSLKKFREGLSTGPAALLSPEAQYKATQTAFLDTAAKARLGDETALGNLQSVSQAYLDASKAYYASSGRYFDDLAAVKAAVQAAEGTATRTADNATQQLDALKASVSGLIDINQNVISVRDAIIALQTALAAQVAAGGAGGSTTPFSPAVSPTGSTAPGFTSPSTPTVGGGDPANANWTTYGQHNPDVAQSYASGWLAQVAADMGLDQNGAYRWHWMNYGQAEGRVPYARGGIMDRPMTLGEAGIGGEAGPEGILPLTNVGGRLGVHAVTNDNSDQLAELIAETKANRDELKALRAQLAKHGEATVGATDRAATRTERALTKPTTSRLAGGGRA